MEKDKPLTPHRRVCFLLLLFVALLLAASLLLDAMPHSIPYLNTALALLIAGGGILALYVWREKPDARPFFRFKRITWQEGVLWFFFGVCANCAGTILNIPVNLFWSQWIVPTSGVAAPQSLGEYLLGVLCIAGIPAICEELFCRGILLREYEAYGKKAAVWASALAFAFLHDNVTSLVFTILLGVVLALLVERTESIYPAMIFHFAVNFFSLTMSYVSETLIPPHMQPTFSLALNLFFVFLALTFVFSFLLFLKNTKREEAPPPNDERPKLGFSLSLVVLIGWYLYSQILLFL